MPLFENKKVKQIEEELGVTKTELDSFVTKTANTIDSLERMIQRENGSSATYQTLIRDFYKIGDPYLNNVFVRKAIDKIAGTIAGTDVSILNAAEAELPDNNEAVRLFSYINEDDSTYDFFYEIVRSLSRYGKAHVLKSKETRIGSSLPMAMYNLDSNSIKAKVKDGMLQYWEYKVGDKVQRFDPERILFIRIKHPTNPFDGLAPGSAAAKEIMLDFYAYVFNIKNMQNGAMGKGAWVDPSGSTLTPKQHEEAQFAVDSTFNKGVDGAGKAPVLSRQLNWVRTSETNRDIEFINLLNKMRDDILVAYDVPKVLFTSSETTFTNLKEAKKLFWNQTLFPIIKKIEDSFNTNFFNNKEMGNIPFTLKFKTDGIPELQEDLNEKIDSAIKLYSMNVPVSVINEMLGLGIPEEGWDGWDQPANQTFQFDSKPTETKSILDTKTIIDEYEKNKAIEYEKQLNYDKFVLDLEYQKQLNVMLSRERQLGNKVKAFYSDVYKEEIEPFMDRLGLLDKHYVNENKKAFIDDLKSFFAKLNLGERFFSFVSETIGRTFDMGAYRTYSGVGMDFEQLPERTLAFLRSRELKLKDSPEVVKQTIIDVIERGDWSIDSLSKEISKNWKEASLGRAKVIAQTETTAAYNGGKVKGMQELGIKRMKWVNSGDEKVRDSHRIDGQEVEVTGAFTLADGYKVHYPGDGDASHSANCRCVVISILD